MLSYQHGYHAGGPADVMKHLALAALLGMLVRKPRPISYAETHAGRGLYDLAGPQARKTGEAAEGIARITPQGAFADLLGRIRARHGPAAYPGSPLIACEMLRAQDSMLLFELHPAEHAGLAQALGEQALDQRAQHAETAASASAPPERPARALHREDGYAGLLHRAPLRPRAGLVLVDPSYEVKTEYAQTAVFLRRLIAAWPQAVLLVWYPILPAKRHLELIGGLAGVETLRREAAFDLKGGAGMTGSGLLIINAPFGAAQAVDAALAQGAPVLRPMRPMRPMRT